MLGSVVPWWDEGEQQGPWTGHLKELGFSLWGCWEAFAPLLPLPPVRVVEEGPRSQVNISSSLGINGRSSPALQEHHSPYSSPLPPSALPEGLQNSWERPLAMCLKYKDFELAFLLLTKGADPHDISLTEGDTPLHAALHIFLDINGKLLFFNQSFPCGGSWRLELVLRLLVLVSSGKTNDPEMACFLVRSTHSLMGRSDHHGKWSGWADWGGFFSFTVGRPSLMNTFPLVYISFSRVLV